MQQIKLGQSSLRSDRARADANSRSSWAFARRSCGPLRPFGRNSKFRIQNSEFRINWGPRASLAVCSGSGSSLRRSRTTARSCGPPPLGGCGPPIPAGSILLAGSTWHCFGSSGRQPAVADFRRDILQQTRLRSSRPQPPIAAVRREVLVLCVELGRCATDFASSHFHQSRRSRGLLGPGGPAQTRGQPAAERMGVRRKGAVRSPGTAAAASDRTPPLPKQQTGHPQRVSGSF